MAGGVEGSSQAFSDKLNQDTDSNHYPATRRCSAEEVLGTCEYSHLASG